MNSCSAVSEPNTDDLRSTVVGVLVLPVSVVTPALRNAFTSASTRLSFTRNQTWPVRNRTAVYSL